ncbi:hypothetical protein SBV1_2130019 [Verrucomicrobia bacterium]|nr:hypothetical protein SBV1_2130019 [Verrucomicrobiota bacterium]
MQERGKPGPGWAAGFSDPQSTPRAGSCPGPEPARFVTQMLRAKIRISQGNGLLKRDPF